MSKIQTAGANDGECILYGAGMDGVCSIAGKNVEKECGTCSNADKHTEEECGDCSIDPACSCSKCYAETTNFCSIAVSPHPKTVIGLILCCPLTAPARKGCGSSREISLKVTIVSRTT